MEFPRIQFFTPEGAEATFKLSKIQTPNSDVIVSFEELGNNFKPNRKYYSNFYSQKVLETH